jgi:hypothetical protein
MRKMRKSLLTGVALALPILSQPALAEGTIIVAPVYAQLVAFAAPTGFHAGFEAEKNGSYILELVPAGETVDDWSQMITVTGGRGAGAGLSVLDAGAAFGQGYQAACPGTFAARSFPAPRVKGAVSAFSGYLGCGTVDGKSEQMVFVVVQGKEDLYTVQWAEKGPASDKPPEVDPTKWKPRADTLALTRVCDKVPGEAAPYPSCTQ